MTDLTDQFGKPLPPMPFPVPEDAIDTFYRLSRWDVIRKIGPLVPVEWGQGDPYNKKLDSIDGKLPPTGCVPTAVAQIMAFHKYPKAYNWNRIIKEPNSDYTSGTLSSLFKELGKKENLDVDYDVDISLSSSDDVPKTFRNYGYESGELVAYDIIKVEEEIQESRRPVYVRANSTREEKDDGLHYLRWGHIEGSVEYGGGHAWVIDGVKLIKRDVMGFSLLNKKKKRRELWYTQVKYLVHCNFGWNGNANGYYLHKAFNTTNGYESDTDLDNNVSDSDSQKEKTKGGADLIYNHEMITNIRPKLKK